jgi:hypothetical protein
VVRGPVLQKLPLPAAFLGVGVVLGLRFRFRPRLDAEDLVQPSAFRFV